MGAKIVLKYLKIKLLKLLTNEIIWYKLQIMKNILGVFILFFILNSCGSILKKHASWDFMQNAEFKIGLPYKDNDIYYLSFTCNLKKSNSAPLAIINSNAKILKDEINLYLIYTLTEKDNIDKIELGKMVPGIYKIYYIDNDKTKYFIDNIIIE